MDGSRPLVLVADDDRGVLAMVAEYLSARGFDVRAVEDGLQAVVQAVKLKPAVILLDFDMPAASGETVYRRLRGSSATAFIPVVFVTGKLDALRATGLADGALVRALRKPARLADIEAAVRGFLTSAPAQAPAPPSLAAAPAAAARRVLLVDDDRTVLDVLGAELAAAGFSAAAFERGEAALEHARGAPPDLAIVDVGLSGESGLDVCRALRRDRDPARGYLPVILLTARSATAGVVAGLDAGADEYLVKPHKAAELLARMRSMLRLKDAMDRLRLADAFKDELLAITAHDLRNPLSAARGFAQVLLAGDEDPQKRRRSLELIVRNCDSMIALLDRLYQRTRLEAVELAAVKVPTDPVPVVSGLVEKNAAVARSKDVRLECAPRLPRGYKALLDPGLFEEIAANLVGNALKFTPAGGEVLLTLSSSAGLLSLAVRDTGPGIPQAEQKAVFEKFRRAAGARPADGMGYGLAIVSKFAGLHGGRVELESAPGKGCLFTVLIPEA